MGYNKKVNLMKIALVSSIVALNTAASAFAYDKGKIIDAIDFEAIDLENAEIIKTLDIGQTVDILDYIGDSYKIAFEGIQDVFIDEKYISVVEAEATVVGDSVYIREEADYDGKEVSLVTFGDTVTVTGIIGEYYRINYDGKECYIHSDFVIGDMIYSVQKIDSVENEGAERTIYGTVFAENGAYIREEPDENSHYLAVLAGNSVLDVIGNVGDLWIEVLYNDKPAFISSQSLIVQTGYKPDEEPIILETSEYNGEIADQIINYAKQFIGTPYSWGGTNLNRGVDCSGFTYAVMKNNGIYLDRTSRSQSNDGYNISKSDLKKGDLVFFATGGGRTISHVGIYIGDGEFIHSSSGKKWGVTIDKLSSDYYTRNFVTAARVLD